MVAFSREAWRPKELASWAVVLLSTFVWGCGSGADPLGTAPKPPESGQPSGGEVSRASLSAEGSSIEVTNDDEVARNYLLFEAELAAVVDPNLDPAGSEQWIRLGPGESTKVPLDAVSGWTAEAEAVVIYSWTESIAHPVQDGVQWLGDGWYTMRVDLANP